jgi:hypothetical protein
MEEFIANLFISADKTVTDKRIEVKSIIFEILKDNILKTHPTSQWINSYNYDKFNQYVEAFEQEIYKNTNIDDYLKLEKTGITDKLRTMYKEKSNGIVQSFIIDATGDIDVTFPVSPSNEKSKDGNRKSKRKSNRKSKRKSKQKSNRK